MSNEFDSPKTNIVNLLDKLIGFERIGAWLFPIFRFLGEYGFVRIGVTTAGGLAFNWAALEHCPPDEALPIWASILIALGSYTLAYIAISTPCAFVSMYLRANRETDVHINEALLELINDFNTSFTPAETGPAIDMLIDAIEIADQESELHLLTPSPVYLAADRFIQDARGCWTPQDARLLALEEACGTEGGTEPRSKRLRNALKVFRGRLYLVEIDRRSAGVRAACDRRMRSLIPEDGEGKFRKAYSKAWGVLDEIEEERKRENRPTSRHKMLSFPKARLLLLDGMCYGQVLPDDKLGIQCGVSQHSVDDGPELLQSVSRLLRIIEDRTSF